MKTPIIFVAFITFAASSLGQSTMPASLFVHFGYESSDSSKRLLTARIHLEETIFIAGDDHWKLAGRIEQRGTNLVADLNGSTGSQGQFYRGVVELEKPVFGQGGAAGGGVVPLWFAVSTNSDCESLLKSLQKSTRERLEKSK